MCYGSGSELTEVSLAQTILPTSSTGWWRHVDGVGEWMRFWGPEQFSLGIRHRLFTGFRPLLVSPLSL